MTAGGPYLDVFDRPTETSLLPPWFALSGAGGDLYLHDGFPTGAVIVGDTLASTDHMSVLDTTVGSLISGDGWIGVDLSWRILVDTHPGGLLARADTLTEHVALYIIPGVGLELREINGSMVVLDTYAFTVVEEARYQLRLELDGTSLKGYMDGTLRVSGTQGTATTHEDVGMSFIGTPGDASKSVLMDNFRIGGEDGPTLGIGLRGS